MSKRTIAIARATGVIGATAALIVGVTFAALSSTVTLTNSSITSASADLQIWNGSIFTTTAPGFTVTNLVPGTGQEFPFYLKNNGGVPLNITAAVPALPTLTGITGSDYSKVLVRITSDFCGTFVNTSLQSLWSAPVALTCNPLAVGAQGNAGVPNTEGNYKIMFDIDPSAVSGGSASVGPFDIQLTGTQ